MKINGAIVVGLVAAAVVVLAWRVFHRESFYQASCGGGSGRD
jgi:hypothetical protein